MEEATEICKLRLFLKLVAQVDSVDKIEPLPDIDFNIRTGNTLVGFANKDEVRKAITMSEAGLQKQQTLMFGEKIDALNQIEEKAEIAEMAFKKFRQMQTEHGMDTKYFSDAKDELSSRLKLLSDELDLYLASEYGIGRNNMPSEKKYNKEFAKWCESHQPFHWFSEFYGIMNESGFDVIIGNPPYVTTNKIKYSTPSFYRTCVCKDLFALTVERSYSLIRLRGRTGVIIPLSATSTDTMYPLKQYIAKHSVNVWTSYYSASDQPASLFSGVRHRLLILLVQNGTNLSPTIYSTRFLKWFSDERLALFESFLFYVDTSSYKVSPFCKISTELEGLILSKVFQFSSLVKSICRRGSPIYYHNAPVHWGKVFDFVPYFKVGSNPAQRSSHIKEIYLASPKDSSVAVCLLNSSLFYWFNWQYSNCRDLSARNVSNVPIGIDAIPERQKLKFEELKEQLMVDFRKHSRIYRRVVKTVQTEFDSFYPAQSKSLIDQIDRVLAKHYGFTDEELDFITNYDIKYRMGLG